jgi:hypothetical protein
LTQEIIKTVHLDEVGGITVVGEGEGGGNSGQAVMRTSGDWFFQDAGKNCFELVQNYLNIDFTGEFPSHIDPILIAPGELIYAQIKQNQVGNRAGW